LLQRQQDRGLKAWPLIGRHFSEALMCQPILPRGLDFVRRARHEVPPHEDGLRNRFAADKQDACADATRYGHVGPTGFKIVEHAWCERLILQGDVTLEHQERVFVAAVERQRQRMTRMYAKIRPPNGREVIRG